MLFFLYGGICVTEREISPEKMLIIDKEFKLNKALCYKTESNHLGQNCAIEWATRNILKTTNFYLRYIKLLLELQLKELTRKLDKYQHKRTDNVKMVL